MTVKVDGAGTNGSLVGTLHVLDRTNGLSSEVPLRDVGGPKANTGGYPWRLDGDYQTKMHITNVGKVKTRFSARIQMGAEQYIFKTHEVPVGATVTYDIRQLRDAQVPDAYGKVIPSDAVSGQFYWAIYNRAAGAHFAGRAEMVSVKEAVSSSFSCMMCCDPSQIDGFLGASTYELGLDVSAFLLPERRMQDCYESVYWEPAVPDYFDIEQTNVLEFHEDDVSYVTAIDEGSSGVAAFLNGSAFVLVQPEYYEENDHCDESNADDFPDNEIQTALAYPTDIYHFSIPVEYNNGSSSMLARLQIKYLWVSSFGEKSNLNACVIKERISYNPSTVQSPPFRERFRPAGDYFMAFGNAADFVDIHQTAGPLELSGGAPVNGDDITSQEFMYSCPRISGGALQSMSGASASNTITRSSWGNQSTTWFFTVTKHTFSPGCQLAIGGGNPGYCQ